MKKIIVACFAALTPRFWRGIKLKQTSISVSVWGCLCAQRTQDDDSNGAVPIEGTKRVCQRL